MVDQTWPNSQFFRPEILWNPPNQPMWLGASRRHLQRRPPDRGEGPLHFAARKGRPEVVQVLLAAGASVQAKNKKGCGPQRQDRCDRTDVVGRRCNRQNVEEMRHDIEFAASFGNFVPGIFSVLYVDIYRQQLQVGVAGCCGYVTLDIIRYSEWFRWLSQVEETFCGSSIINYGSWMQMDSNDFLAGIVIVVCYCESLIWFAVYGTAEVWLPNQLILISIGSDTCLNMSELEMVDQTWPNSQFFRPEILRNPLNQPMWLGASRRHLQRRPPDRGEGPLYFAAGNGRPEVVDALLAAGASVEAKDDDGLGPQRRDGCDRTDVVGRRCHGFQDEIRWCSPP